MYCFMGQFKFLLYLLKILNELRKRQCSSTFIYETIFTSYKNFLTEVTFEQQSIVKKTKVAGKTARTVLNKAFRKGSTNWNFGLGQLHLKAEMQFFSAEKELQTFTSWDNNCVRLSFESNEKENFPIRTFKILKNDVLAQKFSLDSRICKWIELGEANEACQHVPRECYLCSWLDSTCSTRAFNFMIEELGLKHILNGNPMTFSLKYLGFIARYQRFNFILHPALKVLWVPPSRS